MTISVNDKVNLLEHRIDNLESDLIQYGIDKDNKITNMHSDMLDLKETVQGLTFEIREAVQSLREIANNTLIMKEVVGLYEKWKGFTWVMKNIGFWGAIVLAFVLGIIATVISHQ